MLWTDLNPTLYLFSQAILRALFLGHYSFYFASMTSPMLSKTLSHLNLFADDVLLYRTVACAADFLLLQQVIGCIEQWSTDNYLDFNISKCKYMIISRKRNPLEPAAPLTLFGSALGRVDNYKYLGVLLTDNLSWSIQVKSVCQKARRVLGLLCRRFYSQASQDTLKQL